MAVPKKLCERALNEPLRLLGYCVNVKVEEVVVSPSLVLRRIILLFSDKNAEEKMLV